MCLSVDKCLSNRVLMCWDRSCHRQSRTAGKKHRQSHRRRVIVSKCCLGGNVSGGKRVALWVSDGGVAGVYCLLHEQDWSATLLLEEGQSCWISDETVD